LKRQGLCRSRRHCLEDKPGLAKESREQSRAVLDALESGRHQRHELVEAGVGAVAQAAFEV
jgi:hypothetical protein